MTSNTQAFDMYQRNKILTATPAELTLMLYEGAIKFTNVAVMAIGKKEIERAHNNIQKTQNIIAELKVTLNHKYPVAKEFEKVYDYLLERLLDANLSKDTEILEECLTHLRTMRDTWKEVMKATNNLKA